LAIWGMKNEPLLDIDGPENEPIGRRQAKYGRVQRGTIRRTGNRFEVVYGALRLQTCLPQTLLTLRSDQTPITKRNMKEAILIICGEVRKLTISSLELTFDLGGQSVEWFERRIVSSARKFKMLGDEAGKQTLYVGGPTMPWQVRIYEKRPGVTRLEFIFRRRFLRQCYISPDNLEVLRYLDLSYYISLQRLNAYAVDAIKNNLEPERQRTWDLFQDMLPLRKFVVDAEKRFGAQRLDLLSPDPLNEQLRRMQRQMVC